jgi:rhamnosyltransferase
MPLKDEIPLICATVVLYHPDLKIIDNVLSYSKYVDKVIFVDNSELRNDALITKLKNLVSNSEYIFNGENLGIATALNISCEIAIRSSYKWILTMDQDSMFCDFKKYLKCFQTNSSPTTAVMSPNSELDCSYTSTDCRAIHRDMTITSGSLINLDIFNKIGKFEDKLFIDEVDFEYCLRARTNGYEILFFENIPLKHNLGEINKNISKENNIKLQHNYVRRYYITRNHFYLSSLYGKEFVDYKMKRSIYQYLYRNSWKVLTREDDKVRKILSIFLGFKDFTINKYGKFDYNY